MKVLLIIPALICLTWLLDIAGLRPNHIVYGVGIILIIMLVGSLTLALL